MDEINYPVYSVITDAMEIAVILAQRADPGIVEQLLASHPGRSIVQIKIELSPPARSIWGAFSTAYDARAFKLN